MSSKKIFCGIGKPRKHEVIGSMVQCADQKQIRLYGLKKVDPKVLGPRKNKTKKISREKLLQNMVILRGRVKKLTDNIPYQKTAQKKEDLRKQLLIAKAELSLASFRFKEYENMKANK